MKHTAKTNDEQQWQQKWKQNKKQIAELYVIKFPTIVALNNHSMCACVCAKQIYLCNGLKFGPELKLMCMIELKAQTNVKL